MREGRYKIRLQWKRISDELEMGKSKKQIYEDLKKEGLYEYSYQSFFRMLQKELSLENDSAPEVIKPTPAPPSASFPIARDVNKEEKLKEETSQTLHDEIFGENKHGKE